MNSTRSEVEQFRTGRRRSGRFGKMKQKPSLNLKPNNDYNLLRNGNKKFRLSQNNVTTEIKTGRTTTKKGA
jgi:hypothetical protein